MPLPATQVHETMARATAPGFPNGSHRAGTYQLVFRIRHKETKAVLKEHRLILMPTTFTQETEARTSLYYVAGGIVADTPLETGIGATYFTIAGTTGFRGVIAANSNPLLNRLQSPSSLDTFTGTVEALFSPFDRGLPRTTSLVDGAAAIKDLADTIRAYLAPGERRQTAHIRQTQDLQLEFLNETAPTSEDDTTGRMGWVIHPHRNLVQLRQEAARPWLYYYTFQFAGIAPLETIAVDPFMGPYLDPPRTLRTTLNQVSRLIHSLTNGVNTLHDAAAQLFLTTVRGPITTVLLSAAQLGDAVDAFAGGLASAIQFPLYAQRELTEVLAMPAHSVSTLKAAALQLGSLFTAQAWARSISALTAGTVTTAGVQDQLRLQVNNEAPVLVALGTLATGAAIAQTIQAVIRATAPQQTANTAAYQEFTATHTGTQYMLRSGTAMADGARVTVVVDPDPALTPRDASSLLGLGVANGGQEHPGTDVAAPALDLLQGLQAACTHLLAFPDFFADQLAAQDRALAARTSLTSTRPVIHGEQHLEPARITPGDTIQSLANRVGVPWETLALVNHLSYPYFLMEPGTLARGRVSSAARYELTDVTQQWTPDIFQGERVDCLAGTGRGQSGLILRNTGVTLLIDQAWNPLPDFTTDYAIRQGTNPILQVGTVTSATARTLTDASLDLVPDSQRGAVLLITTGDTAGQRRRIVEHGGADYLLDVPWDTLPASGDGYAVLTTTQLVPARQRVLGESLSVPRPTRGRGVLGVQSRLHEVGGVTGQRLTPEAKLFGRDLRLERGALVWDPTGQDLGTIAGLANLRQALIHLINVPLGELEYHPGLGSYVQQALGQTVTLSSQMQLLHSLARTLKQDGRVRSLAGTELVTHGGRTLLTVAVTAISGETVDRVVIR